MTRRCKSCGREISSNAVFCKFCGTKQDDPDSMIELENLDTEEDDDSTFSLSKGQIRLIAMAAAIVIIALIVVVVLFINGPAVNKGSESNPGSTSEAMQNGETSATDDSADNSDSAENNDEDKGSSSKQDDPYKPGIYSSYSEDFTIPGSDEYYIEYSDYEYLSLDDVQWAINEIYARHGRIFKDEPYSSYFSGCEWYTPTYPADKFDESCFNKYEQSNLKVLSTIRSEIKKQTED